MKTITMKFDPIIAFLFASPAVTNGWSLFRPTVPTLMRPMVVYSPGSILREQRELLNRGFKQTSPRYEITDDEEQFQVAVDVPGVKAEDLDINVEEGGHILSISGHRESTGDNYKFTSKFSQSFSLDPAVEVEKITANLDDGVLVVSAPKDVKQIEEAVRKIPITQEATEKEPIHIETEENAEVKEEISAVKEEVTAA